MTCTAAAIIAFLGFMPPKGTTIIVPKEAADQYTTVQLMKAKLCARRYGINWRIE